MKNKLINFLGYCIAIVGLVLIMTLAIFMYIKEIIWGS